MFRNIVSFVLQYICLYNSIIQTSFAELGISVWILLSINKIKKVDTEFKRYYHDTDHSNTFHSFIQTVFSNKPTKCQTLFQGGKLPRKGIWFSYLVFTLLVTLSCLTALVAILNLSLNSLYTVLVYTLFSDPIKLKLQRNKSDYKTFCDDASVWPIPTSTKSGLLHINPSESL